MLLVDSKNDLGEGPVWRHETKELIWVDYNKGDLCRYHLSSKQYTSIKLAETLMLAMPTDRGNFLLAVKNEVWLYSIKENKILKKQLVDENKPNNRLNDGKCDAKGRLWIGTMDDGAKPDSGALYQVESGLKYQMMDEPYTIPNGIAWNSANTEMYVVDSYTKHVYRYDFNLEDGSIANRKVLIDTSSQEGSPDGMCIDQEDNLWIAFWQGQCLIQYNLSGEIISKIVLPVHIPTSCCFGGDDLSTLFITSSRAYDSPENISKFPLSGGLFAIRTEIAGAPVPLFKQSS
jgi:sugar lactone lactonase YvrE